MLNGSSDANDTGPSRDGSDVKQEIVHNKFRISHLEEGDEWKFLVVVWYDASADHIIEEEYEFFFTPDQFAAPLHEGEPVWQECREEGDPLKWFDCQEPKDQRQKRVFDRRLQHI